MLLADSRSAFSYQANEKLNVAGIGVGGQGHHAEWIRACKGEERTFSPFDVGGPQTEMLLLGNVALLAGHPIEYDPLAGKVVGDDQANQHLHREYRSGWSL